MANFVDILMCFGVLSLIIIALLLLIVIIWGVLNLFICIFSDGYFSGLKNMLDDLQYCRSNLPKILKQVSKCNEHESNTKL